MHNLTRLSSIVRSNLSDWIVEMNSIRVLNSCSLELATERILFVNWIVFNYNDMSELVDADKLYLDFLASK